MGLSGNPAILRLNRGSEDPWALRRRLSPVVLFGVGAVMPAQLIWTRNGTSVPACTSHCAIDTPFARAPVISVNPYNYFELPARSSFANTARLPLVTAGRGSLPLCLAELEMSRIAQRRRNVRARAVDGPKVWVGPPGPKVSTAPAVETMCARASHLAGRRSAGDGLALRARTPDPHGGRHAMGGIRPQRVGRASGPEGLDRSCGRDDACSPQPAHTRSAGDGLALRARTPDPHGGRHALGGIRPQRDRG
jgi:hypothetical protein